MQHKQENSPDILFDNRTFRLVVGSNGLVKSLVVKENGEECLAQDQGIALFSATQERPYNNEVKLAHPNKRTTYQANAIRREGNRLIVGFEVVPFQAIIEVIERPDYLAFRLADFVADTADYPMPMTPPPVKELRLFQLPVKDRTHFGAWLNVSWDAQAAVNVLSTSPYARIDAERRQGYRVMYADALRDVRLQGTEAALIACPTHRLMDVIDTLEKDYDLPRGVASRRDARINASMYWSASATPENIHEHIAWMKKGGFTMMLLYYTCLFEERGGYSLNGNYDYRPEYPNGRKDVRAMLRTLKEHGITPGLHVLQTHIGVNSRYVTPVADHRLHLTRHFTLAQPLDEKNTTITVEQNPIGSVMAQGARVLQFGGELIAYEAYTTQPPYQFTGCRRGAYNTHIVAHPMGQIGGILDVSEFGGSSVYLDQQSSLADEVADKIADAYNAGFEFLYFDGSEGTNAPFEIYVPCSQYRVYRKLHQPPIFTEGAAKAHFSWHYQSGGNAFDIFPPEVFKEKIRQFPCEQAPRMFSDFTRLNFGWWGFWAPGTQPDMVEYGTSRAAVWDCPVTIQSNLSAFQAHPRIADILEVFRRWEDVRARGWLTDAHKHMLRNIQQEHILLVDEDGQYELQPYDRIDGAAGGSEDMLAFILERKGERIVVYWHTHGEAQLHLPLHAQDIRLEQSLGGSALPVQQEAGYTTLPLGNRLYVRSKLSREALVQAFQQAEVC